MIVAIGVVVAGGTGAVCRYLVDGAVQQRWRGPFPAGTFLVNASGSFLLGLVVGWSVSHVSASSDVRTILGTGFVGAYTTFSTLMYETLSLVRTGARRYAVLNLALTLAAGLAAAALGLWATGGLG